MSANKTTISLVATICLMISVCDPASTRELTVINNSNATLPQNKSVDNQFLTVEYYSYENATQMSAVNNFSSPSIPAIYGNRIVWQSFRNVDWNKDIYVYNINNSTNNRITASGSADYPAIYGDKIVWVDSRSKYSDIYMYNLSTQSETQITTSGSADSPAIYEDKIVWKDNRNGWNQSEVYMYNLSTSVETQITTNGSAYYPAIYGDKIVWKDNRNGWNQSEIYMYNLSTSVETQITTSGSADYPAIYGDKIVWKDNRNGWNQSEFYMYNLSTSAETQIITSGSADSPAIYGDRIVWQDYRNGKADIYMYNLSTSVKTQITANGSAYSPAIYGDKIVWVDNRNGWNQSEIYMYNISTSKEILVNTSELSPNVLGKNGTGDIYVYTSLKWSPDSVPLTNATFSIFGPTGEYRGNGSYWARLNAPKGTYTISYEPVSGYDTPTSETKILTEGDSIKFYGDYFRKKRVGESLDFGDGYILIIKQIDSEMKEVSLELQLDERKVAEARVREHGTVSLNKISYLVNKSEISNPPEMTIKKISIDEGGNYIDISFSFPHYAFGSMKPSTYLIIHSIPEGASISLDEKYVGKTSKSLPIDKLKTYSVRLELEGYKSLESQFKFDVFEQQEIQLTLSR
ncbi:PEGA domain-containing protein [Methanosarcina vacuolata]|uniref:Cell surface protein n=1 Tax=Methanosarcina vacuolata Z-761 TaxID=1434123 RepID=A0A0E3Q5B1_9EURY|nr:PEGA domain-containing protein [Methanosarcina vacuolata]AKB43579.1 cell surface protein [Methanosarcina vacuolata Z-761]